MVYCSLAGQALAPPTYWGGERQGRSQDLEGGVSRLPLVRAPPTFTGNHTYDINSVINFFLRNVNIATKHRTIMGRRTDRNEPERLESLHNTIVHIVHVNPVVLVTRAPPFTYTALRRAKQPRPFFV